MLCYGMDYQTIGLMHEWTRVKARGRSDILLLTLGKIYDDDDDDDIA